MLPFLDRQRPINWLELGSFEGRSALWTVENMFLNPDSRVTCVDAWEVGTAPPWPVFQGKTTYSAEPLFDSNVAGIPQVIKRKGRTVDVSLPCHSGVFMGATLTRLIRRKKLLPRRASFCPSCFRVRWSSSMIMGGIRETG